MQTIDPFNAFGGPPLSNYTFFILLFTYSVARVHEIIHLQIFSLSKRLILKQRVTIS
jgi:hypothetical protein